MAFLVAGIVLIASATIFNKTRLNSNQEKNGIEHFGVIAIGGFLFLVGVTGLVAGFYSFNLTINNSIVLAVLIFYFDIQVRLLITTNRSKESIKSMDNSNFLAMLKEAYSIGIFPKGGGYVYLVYVCQVIQSIILLKIFI